MLVNARRSSFIVPLILVLAGCSQKAAPRPRDPAPDLHASGVAHAAAPPAAVPPVDMAGTRTYIDLIDNRVHLVAHSQGHVIARAGDVDFLKYVDGGWKTSWILSDKDGGQPVGFVNGLSSTMFLPVDVDGDGAGGDGKVIADVMLGFSARAVVPKQRVSVFVNEKSVASLDVESGQKDYAVPVPGAALVKGDNRIRFTFRAAGPIAGGRRSAAAFTRVTLGAGPVPTAVPWVVNQVDGRRVLVTTTPSRLSFYTQVPKDARLSLAYLGNAGAKAVVRVAQDGAAAKTVLDAAVSGAWTDAGFDLSAWAGKAVRIDLVSRGGGISWASPRIVVKAAAAEPIVTKTFDRIFIWMVDTLRADKVHAYNPKTIVQTPNYDVFAADATRFAWAQVPGTWSLPSHASILTGVYPGVHKATAHEARLNPKVPFIAEIAKKAGYRTGLFSSNGYVSGKWGFDRGWDETRNFIRESLPNGAEYLWKTARTWTEQPAQKTKSQFLYLATVEPHVIYNPKKEFLAKYWNKPYTGPIKPAMTGIQLGSIKSGKLKPTDTDKAYLEALHNAEITQSDHAFGNFLADLKTAGVYETSAVVVISDHGDEFWEHGDVGHAQGVHQELVHIPLLIRAPGVFPTGKVVDVDVEAMDLHPTMVELLGQKLSADVQGSSLVGLSQDELLSAPRVAMTQNLGISRGIKVGRYRFIHAGTARMELYDVVKDPLEQQDVAAAHPIAVRHMRGVLGLLVAYENRWKKSTWGTAADVNEAFYKEASLP